MILTAKGEESYRVLGLEMGADDDLSKPFSPGDLLDSRSPPDAFPTGVLCEQADGDASNIGLDRQDARFGRGDQNKGRNAVGRYCSEYKNSDGPRTRYSITVRVPDMSSWPSPQKTSQKNANLPAWSGTNRTLWTAPGVRSARR